MVSRRPAGIGHPTKSLMPVKRPLAEYIGSAKRLLSLFRTIQAFEHHRQLIVDIAFVVDRPRLLEIHEGVLVPA